MLPLLRVPFAAGCRFDTFGALAASKNLDGRKTLMRLSSTNTNGLEAGQTLDRKIATSLWSHSHPVRGRPGQGAVQASGGSTASRRAGGARVGSGPRLLGVEVVRGSGSAGENSSPLRARQDGLLAA